MSQENSWTMRAGPGWGWGDNELEGWGHDLGEGEVVEKDVSMSVVGVL